MNKKVLLCLTLALSSLAPVTKTEAASSIEVYENRPVNSIRVQMQNLPEDSTFNPRSIISKLRTQEGDPFSQYVFDQDLKTLAGDYDRVEPYVTVENGDVNILLKVWLKPKIVEIRWEGNTIFKTKKLQKQLDVKPGTIFDRTEFNKQFNKVKEFYIKKGYFESQLQYTVLPKTGNEVEILINVSEGRAGRVQQIIIEGLSKDEESELITNLYTKKYNLLTSWFTGRGKFNEDAMEQDRLQIYDFLQNKGYADAQVSINVIDAAHPGRIVIEICIDKGALYHFGCVSFDGNELFSDQEIERIFLARPGDVYSPENIRKTAQAIKDLYGRKGHIDASVTYETQLDPRNNTYNVFFQISEGKPYKIGLIRVVGNTQTESRVILRESLLIPGETFDTLRLKVTQSRLEAIGYFKSVNVYAVRTQDDVSLGENYRDVYIEVEEQPTGHVSLFTGYSSADNIFGGLDLTETNFNYRGIPRVFKNGVWSVRGGGEFLHMRASFGAKQQSYLLSWMTPYFLDSMWRTGFEFNLVPYSILIDDKTKLHTYTFRLFANYPLSAYWTFGTYYRAKSIEVELKGRINEEASETPKKTRGFLSGLGANISWDSTDSAVKPHNGLRSVLSGEVVGLGGDLNFGLTFFQNSYYTGLWRHGYMKYIANFRFLFPFGKTDEFADIPMSERFFLGGAASVRGYKDFILGSRIIREKRVGGELVNKKSNDPTGGISSSLLSVEYVQEIFPFLDAFAFIDAGYVTRKVFHIATYRMSYGVGLNIDVMGKMPVTLGMGFPVNARKGQTVKNNFFIQMGTQF